MDEELKALAELALRNAFYRDFSDLVNLYLEAAAGLDTDRLERQLAETASVYGRDTGRVGPLDLEITALCREADAKGSFVRHKTYDSVQAALSDNKAFVVWLQSEKVFERRDGEWYFTENEE